MDTQLHTATVRPGCVEYVDLMQFDNMTREAFFAPESFLKTLRVYGLILECDDVVKILFYDDISENEQCEGIVVPTSCIISITYFIPDKSAALLSKSEGVN